MGFYRRKAVRCGDVLELYTYGYLQPEERAGNKSPGRSVKAATEEKSRENRDRGVSRAKRELRRLVNANWNQWGCKTAFMTLTYKDNQKDLHLGNKHFHDFCRRFEYHYGNKLIGSRRLQYTCVPEFQERGAVHYHLAIFNMPYINTNEIAKVWGHGFIRLNAKDYNNLGSYMSKYMGKDFDDDRLKAEKSFFRSRGLLQWTETKDDGDINETIKDQEPVYQNTYDNDFQGRTLYQVFRIKNKGCSGEACIQMGDCRQDKLKSKKAQVSAVERGRDESMQGVTVAELQKQMFNLIWDNASV